MGMSRQFGRSAYLIAVVVACAVAMSISLWRVQGLQRSLSQPIPENILWAAAQLEIELMTVIIEVEELARTDVPRNAKTVEEAQLRFDILWSRLELFRSGTLYNAVAQTDGLLDLISRMAFMLRSLDPLIADLATVHPDQLDGMIASLVSASKEIRSLTVTALHKDREQRQALRLDAERAVVYGAISGFGMLLGGTILVWSLLRSDRRLRDSLEAATVARKEAERANAAKSSFLAMMSHELRTPMNGVLGALGLVGDGPLAPSQRHLVDVARTSAEGLLTILNDILDFSKVEAGKLELEPHRFSLKDLLEAVMSLCVPLASEKQIRIDLVRDRGIPDQLIGDSARIKQMLINLVGNAIKFTHTGGVQVAVTLLNQASDQLRLRFAIIDTGIGIPSEKQEVVFQSFNQVDSSIARRYGGTGLGLSITRQISHLMGGDIGFDSIEGHGSTFWIDVPLTVAAPEEGPDPQEEHAPANDGRDDLRFADGRPVRILLVEDNVTNQLVIKMMIQKLGGHVDTAGNGREAIAAVKACPYDAVLMDISMPVMDGLEATRIIREQISETLPIFALTANALKEDADRYIAGGMQACLTKPVKKQELVRAVQSLAGQGASVGQKRTANGPSRWGTLPSGVRESGLDDTEIATASENLTAVEWIDENALREMADDVGTAVVDTILQTFAIDIRRLGDAFMASTHRKEPYGMRAAAHALAGSSATFGAPALHRVSKKIDLHLKQKEVDAAIAEADQMDAVCNQTVAAIDAYRKKLVSVV